MRCRLDLSPSWNRGSRRGFDLRRLLAIALSAVCLLAAADPATAELAPVARAQALLEQGRLYPAERAAREALSQNPDAAAVHQLLGEIMLRRRRADEAIASLSRARELDASLPGLDRALADARLLLGDDAGACAAYARALAAVPEDARAALRRAQCAEQLGKIDAAEAALERAAQHPEYAQIAFYRLGMLRARAGRRDAAREALERAVFIDPPSALAGRAWADLQSLEQRERSWSLEAAVGLVFDDNVTRSELDVTTGEPDQAVQLELDTTWQPRLPSRLSKFDLELGYGLLQTRYFDTDELDLQSHSMSASLRHGLGPGSASLSYLYSLNTLGQKRFLDLQDIRPAYGLALRPYWYLTLAPALQIKRFDQSPERNALAGFFGALQLFDLSGGSWDRYLLVGLEGDYEDADGREFDARGLMAQTALHWSLVVGERVLPFDLRYRYRLRDFLHETTLTAAVNDSPALTTDRQDSIHDFRARASLDLHRFSSPGLSLSLDLEYELEDSESNLPSADYTQNRLTLLLRFSP
jgi:tetratricopeptide (TPR) repeat protein